MDGKWETVIDRKKSRTGTKPQHLQQNGTAATHGVFAAIDDWKPSSTFACCTGTLGVSVLTHCLHHGRATVETSPDLAGRGAQVYEDDDTDGPPARSQQRESDASTATHANGHIDAAKAPAKPKQPKPKPPKRSTPMQAAQALDTAELRKARLRVLFPTAGVTLPHPATLPSLALSVRVRYLSASVFACHRCCRKYGRNTPTANSRSWRR